jgi:LysM repeat protein
LRPNTATHRGGTSNTLAVGIPAAFVGAIALALSAAPAHAEERSTSRIVDDRALRVVPVQPAAASQTASSVQPMAKKAKTYTVRRGDTVSAIAARHGLRTNDVLALNGLSWKSVIYPGQVLKLSAGSTPAKAPAKPAAAKPAAKPAATSGATHTIKAGDTIYAIALRNGVSTKAVLSANGLNASSIIYPGQKITIPGKSASAPAASKPAASKPAASKPAPAKPAAPATSGSYTIKAGDTIYAIALRHGVSSKAVLATNGLNASSIIYPGQKITIPGKTVAATKPAAPKPAPASAGSSSGAASVPKLDSEQAANAKLIIKVGRELGVPERGIAIALGTAMQESWIRNLDWGDRDSLGLFQQRPSTGWGTAAQVRDKVRSIKAFYGGPSDPNGYATRGLLDIPGWQKMSYAQAAQAVQISAYPDRYAQWEKPSYAWLEAHG